MKTTHDLLQDIFLCVQKNQLPLAPPVLTGFFMAPEDLVLDFAINFEAPA
jgi:hypothetical protein